MTKRKSDFDEFMREVEAEAIATGNAEDLAVYGAHFRLAAQTLRLRTALGLTQQQLSEATGVQQSEISRIERGQGNPTYRTLTRLAVAGGKRIAFVSERRARVRRSKRKTRASRSR